MAYNLRFSKDVCQILATLCSLNVHFVYNALRVSEKKLYRKMFIPKKRGGIRILNEPCLELKIVQEAFLQYLYRGFGVDRRMFGFVPNKSIVDMAKYHIWYKSKWSIEDQEWKAIPYLPKYIIRMDLKDAFPSATDDLLRDMYLKMYPSKRISALADGFNEKMRQEFIELLLFITSYQGCLPQGAPTSPYLLNLAIMHSGALDPIDRLAREYIKTENDRIFKLSIWADDIVVSTNGPMSMNYIKKIQGFINWQKWFKINKEKTWFNDKARKAHVILGLALTIGADGQPKVILPKAIRKKIRGFLYQATLALQCAQEPTLEKSGVSLNQAHGYVAYVRQVYADDSIPPDIASSIRKFQKAYEYYKMMQKRYRFVPGNRHWIIWLGNGGISNTIKSWWFKLRPHWRRFRHRIKMNS